MSDKLIHHHGNFYTTEQIREVVLNYYKNSFLNKKDRHYVIPNLCPEIGKQDHILDYGCGMGGISKLFVDLFQCNVDAIDLDANELAKATAAYSDIEKIHFQLVEQFNFPKGKYSLVFSAQVAEHVHNVGNYFARINQMTKENGYLLISIPNVLNLSWLINLLLLSNKRALQHSKSMIDSYRKETHHINSWDPTHFITLLASCGYELIRYLPTEGIPISGFIKKVPLLGRILPSHLYIKIPFLNRLSYTNFYLFKKVRDVSFTQND